ncbi:MAG: polysaccharide deacetylase family protein [Thermomicrobiales bacterium]
MHRFGRKLLTGAGFAAVAQFSPLLGWTPLGGLLFPMRRRVASTAAAALTFDDGPDRGTGAFPRELDRLGLRATFFLSGEQVAIAPNYAREIFAAGHEIGIHGYTHQSHLERLPTELTDDLKRARAMVENTILAPVTLFRPPYGTCSIGSWQAARRLDLEVVLWSRWGRDWEAKATAESIARLIGAPRAGEILLLHDSDRYSTEQSWRRTLAALPIIAERWAAAGVGLAPFGELLEEAAGNA